MTRDYCSALRRAYQGIHKRGIKGNDLKIHVKQNYSRYLSATWIADACLQAGMINQEHSVFGGKANWHKLQSGLITKEQWVLRKNSQLYARGEKSREGNRQIRFSDDLTKVYINSAEGRNKWFEGKLYIPKKFTANLDLTCYSIRLLYKEAKDAFEIRVEFDVEEPKQVVYSESAGVIGIDVNPKLAAVVETDDKGNMKSHTDIKAQRIEYARRPKRDYDIYCLAKEVVEKALISGKPIILEDLRFTSDSKKKGSRKFRRTKSNFTYAKIVTAVENRARRHGVKVIKVNPAFTSKLGLLKYADMYSLNAHDAAALCIARRGQGIERERKTYNESIYSKKVKGKPARYWNLEGRKNSAELTDKAHSWLNDCFVREGRQFIDNRTSQVNLSALGQPKH